MATNTTEELSNQARGYKATLSNPNVSEAAKEHARAELEKKDGGPSVPDEAGETTGKNVGNIAGGLKAAIKNPNVTEEGKQAAQEKLDSLK